MIYKGHEIDENHKTHYCSICGNEEITEEGEFCSACGVSLINKCEGHWEGNYNNQVLDSCGKLAAGNARYCIYCGGETSFLRNGLLKPWNQTQEYLEVAAATETNDEDMPF